MLTIYKSFVRPHLDYGDVIYDKPNNVRFSDKIESLQYNAALAITGAIRGTSREKLYHELGLESLNSRRWFRRLSFFFKIWFNQAPEYLFHSIPLKNPYYSTRNSTTVIPQFFCRTDVFKNSFFPSTISDWNKLDVKIRESESYARFRNGLLKFIRPVPSSYFGISDFYGLKLLTRLRLELSHLREHKFNHNFRDTINPLCSCSLETESTKHYFLRCHHYVSIRNTLLSGICKQFGEFKSVSESNQVQILLYGNEALDFETNHKILTCTIKFIVESKRFEEPLL